MLNEVRQFNAAGSSTASAASISYMPLALLRGRATSRNERYSVVRHPSRFTCVSILDRQPAAFRRLSHASPKTPGIDEARSVREDGSGTEVGPSCVKPAWV
jgi:hypothetical protein